MSSQLIDAFLDALWLERGASMHTLDAYRRDLMHWQRYLSRHDMSLLAPDSQTYQNLIDERRRDGYQARSDARLTSSLRRFYRWALVTGQIHSDPLADIVAPRASAGLPGTLEEEEVERLLGAPDVTTALGLRDRAMLEVLYSCGLRVSELVGLRVDSINLRQGVVRVLGKGDAERLVPMGEPAIEWLERYLREGRGELMADITRAPLFPGRSDGFMMRQTFWYRIKHHAIRAGIDASLSPHTLRHAFATHLLNHGANLRVLQELLGHRDLSTTQIYTRVAQARLEAIHAKHHPRG
ncbi:site-specific tyrosine recombinase XerD [Kushneria sp. Sum13]|uniref:site-specific tyrosine recombinase XerD n=1 Tax=Kushneria sp. Sum13 TaxID=3459196 RepID=UPI0040455A42